MNNYIKGEINIEEEEINKDIRIINSLEEYYKRTNRPFTDINEITNQLTMLKLVFHIFKNLANQENMI